MDATGHQWVVGLVNYNFTLNYCSGKINVDADALSHIPKGGYDQSIEAELICNLFLADSTGHHIDRGLLL